MPVMGPSQNWHNEIVWSMSNTHVQFYCSCGVTSIVNIKDYLREVSRVPDVGGKAVQFKLTRANLAVNFCMALNLNVFEEIPRPYCLVS